MPMPQKSMCKCTFLLHGHVKLKLPIDASVNDDVTLDMSANDITLDMSANDVILDLPITEFKWGGRETL